ncbi:MAG: alpha/beta fold hydrolase [Candidatus Dormibacteria bacterium]
MSRFETHNGSLHYQLDGAPTGAPLVLLNALGTTVDLWRAQLPALCRYFQVLRFDYPGHGGSDARSEAWSLAEMGDQLLALLDQLDISEAAFCGLSMGGMIGLSIAARHPGRVRGLVAACAPARMPSGDYWRERAARVRAKGLRPLRDQLLTRWFSQSFLDRSPATVAEMGAQLSAVDPGSYAAACEALGDADLTPQLGEVEAPTLVLAGSLDQAVPPALALELQAGLPRAGLRVLAGAGHLLNVEQPGPFAGAVLGQLTGGQWERGLARRREVLGDAHVERALAAATDFSADFQELITRYAWGEVWARPGLDRFTRRCLTIALLVSLGRWEELEMHLQAATQDLTPEQVAEVLLHTAIYCGVPAANSAFEHARRALFPVDQGS